MQSHISPLKRQSMNQGYVKQNHFNRRSVYANRFHNPIVSNFDHKTHRNIQNQENHLRNTLQPNVSYLVIKRVNSPTHRNQCFQENVVQIPSSQDSQSFDEHHRVFEEHPQKYEYFVRYPEHTNNDKNIPSSNNNKTKIKPSRQKQNYQINFLGVPKNDPFEEQTLELEDSFQEEQRLRNNRQKDSQTMNGKNCFIQKSERKSRNKKRNVSRRRSTNDFETPQRQEDELEQEYLVIKRNPRSSSRNSHFVEYGRLSKESKNILEDIERFYQGDSEDTNGQIIGGKSQKHFRRILSQKKPSYGNHYHSDQVSMQSEQPKKNPNRIQRQIKKRIKDIENIIEIQNGNLKEHNDYLISTIKKMQTKDRNQRAQIQKQAAQIQKLVQERNAYMQRCLQLQHFVESANTESLDHYLQNSTTVDTQNETLNATQSKNKEKLEQLRRHLHGSIQSSKKQTVNKNDDEYGFRKHHHVPTPKFSSNRQSPEHVRKIESKQKEILLGDESSEVINFSKSRDQNTNTNSRLSATKSLSNNFLLNFQTKQVSEEENSESSQSDSQMAKYNTQPPNTPLPLCLNNKMITLNDKFNELMKQYKSTRDAKIRKECVNIALKIKELSKAEDMPNDNGREKTCRQKRGLQKMESLEMEIQQNKAKYYNQQKPYEYGTSRMRSN